MFKHSQRMNSREFTDIYLKGKKYFSPFFRVVVGADVFKVAVVIPKKKLKKRVKRNKEKRRIMHALKNIFNTHYPKKHIIIFLQKDTSDLSFKDLLHELHQLVKKIDK